MARTTPRIRRITQSRRPHTRRSNPDLQRRPLRADASPPGIRRLTTLARPQPGPPPARPARRRRSVLRLVAVNARPRRRKTPLPKPELRLLPGRAPMLALPRRITPAPPRPRPVETSSRLGQLMFVLTMAAIGLAALATSVGQILNRHM